MYCVYALWIFKCDFVKNLSPWWFAVSAAGQSNYRVIPQGNIRKSCHFSSFLHWMKVLLFYKSLSCTKSTCKPIKYQTADVVFLCLGKQLFRITVIVRWLSCLKIVTDIVYKAQVSNKYMHKQMVSLQTNWIYTHE